MGLTTEEEENEEEDEIQRRSGHGYGSKIRRCSERDEVGLKNRAVGLA